MSRSLSPKKFQSFTRQDQLLTDKSPQLPDVDTYRKVLLREKKIGLPGIAEIKRRGMKQLPQFFVYCHKKSVGNTSIPQIIWAKTTIDSILGKGSQNNMDIMKNKVSEIHQIKGELYKKFYEVDPDEKLFKKFGKIVPFDDINFSNYMRENYDIEYILSPSFRKLYEIIVKTEILDGYNGQNFQHLSLCDFSGSHILAVNYYLKTMTDNKNYDWYIENLGIFPKSKQQENDYGLYNRFNNRINNVSSGSSEISKYMDFWQPKGYADLITNNCNIGTDEIFKSDQKSIKALLISLMTLKKGGNLILNIYLVSTPLTFTLQLLLYLVFEEICLVKPPSSNNITYEYYVVCKRYLRNIEMSIVKELWMKVSNVPNVDEINQYSFFPEDFVRSYSDFFNFFVNSQQDIFANVNEYNLNKYAIYSNFNFDFYFIHRYLDPIKDDFLQAYVKNMKYRRLPMQDKLV